MIPPSTQEIARFRAAFDAVPGDLRPDIDAETLDSVLDAAGRLADEVLAPLDPVADQMGCRLDGGRVRTPKGYGAAWRALAEGGWLGLDQPEAYGGSALPITLRTMVTALFDRACPGFGMAPGATVSAAALLAEHAPAAVAEDWIPALLSGDRTATIAISEADAGSDVGRIRTRAVPDGGDGGGGWRIHGSKQWISFGDHDLAPLIGHCLLARSGDQPGGRGLSLFLVPSLRSDGTRNAIQVIRIEEKLGLHGSPTCALSFDGAEAVMLGAPERGLPQLFTMIVLMRLQVGCQGLACAARATEIAQGYASARRQGGDPSAPPVPIAQHPDVARHLHAMRSRTETLRAALLHLSALLDRGPEDGDASALAQFLLPLIKAHGAETGFDVANAGIQVLGGAGYTRDWPLEQSLRDIRVASIYEGTTGMQAIDFLDRRLIRDSRGFDLFCAQATGPVARAFAALVADIRRTQRPETRLSAADAVLRAGWLAITEWLAPRLPEDARPVDLEAEFALRAATVSRICGCDIAADRRPG